MYNPPFVYTLIFDIFDNLHNGFVVLLSHFIEIYCIEVSFEIQFPIIPKSKVIGGGVTIIFGVDTFIFEEELSGTIFN